MANDILFLHTQAGIFRTWKIVLKKNTEIEVILRFLAFPGDIWNYTVSSLSVNCFSNIRAREFLLYFLVTPFLPLNFRGNCCIICPANLHIQREIFKGFQWFARVDEREWVSKKFNISRKRKWGEIGIATETQVSLTSIIISLARVPHILSRATIYFILFFPLEQGYSPREIIFLFF